MAHPDYTRCGGRPAEAGQGSPGPRNPGRVPAASHHHIMALHLRLLVRQLVVLHFEAVILSLKELEFVFDPVTRLSHREFKSWLPWLMGSRMSALRIHGREGS